jgi:hypothetical protein
LEVIVSVLGYLNSDPVLFSYNPPTIAFFDPVSSATNPAGVSFQVSGTNFGISLDDVTITVGSVVVALTSVTHTVASGSAPYGAGKDLTVTVSAGGQVATSCCYNYNSPSISSLAASTKPTNGGVPLTLYGLNFASTLYSAQVLVDGVTECPYAGSHTQNLYVCTLPEGSGTVDITILIEGWVSNVKTLTYDTPTISSTDPTTLPTGVTSLTLAGTNFGDVNAEVIVLLGDVQLVVESWTHEELVVTTQVNQAKFFFIYVTVSGVAATGFFFQFDAPTLLSVGPNLAATDGGDLITISGTSLGIPFGTSTAFGSSTFSIFFGGQSALLSSSTENNIIVSLPVGQGNVSVTATIDTQPSNTLYYQYGSPVIDTFGPSPIFTREGLVTLTGSNFGTGIGSTVVVGGLSCDQGVGASWLHSQVICVLPESNGGTSVDAVITVADQTASITFDYSLPTIETLTSTNFYTDGTGVFTLTGFSFGISGQNQLYFNGTELAATSWDHTEITAEVPVGFGDVDVIVTVGGRDSSPFTFSYAAPIISSTSISSKPTTVPLFFHLCDTLASCMIGGSNADSERSVF